MKQNQNTEPVILEVSKSPTLSMAKAFGSITLNDKKYSYVKSQDALIRFDLVKKYTTFVEQRRSWGEFIDSVKN